MREREREGEREGGGEEGEWWGLLTERSCNRETGQIMII